MEAPRKTKKARQSETNFSLPQDVEHQILMKLPAKSLMRFKCVSRDWYSLITADSYFISSHFHHHLKNSTPLSLILANPRDIRVEHSRIFLLRNDSDVEDLDISYITNDAREKTIRAMTVCNGLVCLSFSRSCADIVLWNPATREFKHLPEPPPFATLNHGEDLVNADINLGFDAENKGYKLVRMEHKLIIYNEIECRSSVQVFSFARNSWRDIKPLLGTVFSTSGSVEIDGVFYWKRFAKTVWSAESILSFDLRGEEFHEIYPPSGDLGGSTSLRQLVKWNNNGINSLGAMMQYRDYVDVFGFWLMENEVSSGPRRAWTKLYMVRPLHSSCNWQWRGAWNGRFLVARGFRVLGGELFVYDTVTGEEKIVVERNLVQPWNFDRSFEYSESLVSVNIPPS